MRRSFTFPFIDMQLVDLSTKVLLGRFGYRQSRHTIHHF